MTRFRLLNTKVNEEVIHLSVVIGYVLEAACWFQLCMLCLIWAAYAKENIERERAEEEEPRGISVRLEKP